MKRELEADLVLPEFFVDIFRYTPLFPLPVCELGLPGLSAHRPVLVCMIVHLVSCVDFTGVLRRFVPSTVRLGAVGLLRAGRSTAGDGRPPPAGCGPCRLRSVAHFGGFSRAVIFYLPGISGQRAKKKPQPLARVVSVLEMQEAFHFITTTTKGAIGSGVARFLFSDDIPPSSRNLISGLTVPQNVYPYNNNNNN